MPYLLFLICVVIFSLGIVCGIQISPPSRLPPANGRRDMVPSYRSEQEENPSSIEYVLNPLKGGPLPTEPEGEDDPVAEEKALPFAHERIVYFHSLNIPKRKQISFDKKVLSQTIDLPLPRGSQEYPVPSPRIRDVIIEIFRRPDEDELPIPKTYHPVQDEPPGEGNDPAPLTMPIPKKDAGTETDSPPRMRDIGVETSPVITKDTGTETAHPPRMRDTSVGTDPRPPAQDISVGTPPVITHDISTGNDHAPTTTIETGTDPDPLPLPQEGPPVRGDSGIVPYPDEELHIDFRPSILDASPPLSIEFHPSFFGISGNSRRPSILVPPRSQEDIGSIPFSLSGAARGSVLDTSIEDRLREAPTPTFLPPDLGVRQIPTAEFRPNLDDDEFVSPNLSSIHSRDSSPRTNLQPNRGNDISFGEPESFEIQRRPRAIRIVPQDEEEKQN